MTRKKHLAALIAVLLFLQNLTGCTLQAVETQPQDAEMAKTDPTIQAEPKIEPEWVTYDASEDAPFLPKDIFSEELYVPGITLSEVGAYNLNIMNQTDVGAFVLEGEYGKCYEVKIPAGVAHAKATCVTTDPRTLPAGDQLFYGATNSLSDLENPEKEICFMYNCRSEGEYLVVYTGTADPIYIGERTIIGPADTQGPWYIPEPVGSISKDKTLGDISWSAEEILDNLYEPVRTCYPDYITRTTIGKDETGQYDMYCYEYAPENYETTMFLTGGMHGDEVVGYFALAKTMQLIADATPEDPLLYTLRQKVRFVVIPLINVWSISTGKMRSNGTSTDLNRDFAELTQQETKNVMACFEKYADQTEIAMDFHISTNANASMWFNFINYSDNAVANYKTTNHMYHRYLQLGHAVEKTDLSKVPGSYKKGNQYLEGLIWNKYGVPTITVEYMENFRFPAVYSNECMTLAVETYANFIIQNALFFLQGD